MDMEAAIYKGSLKSGTNNTLTKVVGFMSMRVNAVQSARVIGAPVEDGRTSFDNKVIDPTKVVVTGVIDLKNLRGKEEWSKTVASLNEMLANREYSFYTVCDGFNVYSGLILEKYPKLRDVDKYDFLNIELTFTEAMLVQTEKKSTANSEDSNTRNLGYQNGVAKSGTFRS